MKSLSVGGGAYCIVVTEKRWFLEEKSAHNRYEARSRALKGRESDAKNPEIGAARKHEKNSDVLDTGKGYTRLQKSTLQAWTGSR